MAETKKISDLIAEHQKAGKPFYSFEYFPPKTEDGETKLRSRLARMGSYKPEPPLFMDVTWGAGGSTAEKTVDICTEIQKKYGLANMHITCTNMKVEKLTTGLAAAKKANIRNLVALRGDPPKGEEKWTATEGGFTCALDLVKYIRKEYGDFFCIAVAGYPEGHPDCESVEKDLDYLKQKVDAGADLIITQLFYDTPLFIEWVKKCREKGIKVPILPGIMPILTYGGFRRMTGFCKTKIPAEIDAALEEIKDDAEAVKAYGVKLATKMCQDIVKAGVSPGIHLYTLNLEAASCQILENLKMIEEGTLQSHKKNKVAESS